MTTRPRLKLGSHLLPGVVAVALFAVLSWIFLSAPFGAANGFPGDGSITASIGYAMFDIAGGTYESEPFLVAFEIIDVVLVAALAAAVMLARREESGDVITALNDGGWLPGRSTGSTEPAGRGDEDEEPPGDEEGA